MRMRLAMRPSPRGHHPRWHRPGRYASTKLGIYGLSSVLLRNFIWDESNASEGLSRQNIRFRLCVSHPNLSQSWPVSYRYIYIGDFPASHVWLPEGKTRPTFLWHVFQPSELAASDQLPQSMPRFPATDLRCIYVPFSDISIPNKWPGNWWKMVKIH